MTPRILSLVTLTVLFLGPTCLLAHDEFRIIGNITRLQDSQLQVKDKTGKTFSIKINNETYIHRDKEKEKAPVAELKNGRSVVVDALGDSEADLLAVEVRIVPAIGGTTPK
jgi:hypothetical protein